MRMMTFAKRCAKEILRDPINLFFGLGFPLVLLLLLSAIQASIPVDLFAIDTLTPGMTVFGLAFMTLFSATLIARDRETALLQRLSRHTIWTCRWSFSASHLVPRIRKFRSGRLPRRRFHNPHQHPRQQRARHRTPQRRHSHRR